MMQATDVINYRSAVLVQCNKWPNFLTVVNIFLKALLSDGLYLGRVSACYYPAISTLVAKMRLDLLISHFQDIHRCLTFGI